MDDFAIEADRIRDNAEQIVPLLGLAGDATTSMLATEVALLADLVGRMSEFQDGMNRLLHRVVKEITK